MQTTFNGETWFLNLLVLATRVEARLNLKLRPMESLPENDNEIVVSQFIEEPNLNIFLGPICQFKFGEEIEPHRAIWSGKKKV